MKKVIKFQLIDIFKVLLIYYLIMIVILAISNMQLSMTINGKSIMNNGTGLSAGILCFVAGLCIFKEQLCFFIQNGVPRKTFFKGTLMTIAIVCAVIAIIETIISVIFTFIIPHKQNYKFTSLIDFAYPGYFRETQIMPMILVSVLFTTLLAILLFITGYLIAAIFYRSGKFMKVAIAVGLPVIILFVLPISGLYFPNVWKKIYYLLEIISGVRDKNPLIAVFTFCISIAIISFASYKVVKKAEV